MAAPSRRALLSVSAFLLSCGLAGSFILPRVSAQSQSDESTLNNSLKDFTSVYALVEQNYAEKLNGDRTDKVIYDGAIPGMLHTLDPHSNFFDPKAYAQMREDQHGRYYGVGMLISPQLVDGALKIFVAYPFDGAPSSRAGIKPGDQILTIDGVSTDGMDSTKVATLLKGPRGTHVVVTMGREGREKPITFDLVRDEIPHPSVDLAFMIQPGIGYMHVKDFSSENTAREVQDALDKFQADNGNLKGLVIDLRANPGGLLNQAVDMSDKFLKKGQVIVSQRGRVSPVDHFETAAHGEQGPRFPVVVLVNRNTASAAEIVSGALQDHDRALIVGETTFGKGLVQTVFNISQNTGLALTTFHYYTPSGRLIQRPYDHLSLYDYYYVREASNPKNNANREVKLTDAGRTVYGGGGITPDEHIDPIKSNHFQDSMLIHFIFPANFAKHYLATHTIDRSFQVDDAVIASFKAYLKSKNVDYTDADIAANMDWLKQQIKTDLFTSQFGLTEGLKVHALYDPQIAKAIGYLPEAQTLLDHPQQAKPASVAAVH